MGINIFFYEDSITQKIHFNEKMENRNYLYIQQEVDNYRTLYNISMILNTFGQLFESEIDAFKKRRNRYQVFSLFFGKRKIYSLLKLHSHR